jgi:transcriptional regulator GlxA family with amidase domain
MHRISIWVFDGCMASAVNGPVDVFHVANRIWSGQNGVDASPLFCWRMESPDGKPVITSSGVKLDVDGAFGTEPAADVLLIPGTFFGRGIPYFLQWLNRVQSVFPLLRRYHAQGTVIAANDSATFLVAEARLLDGGPATTCWMMTRAFRERYPHIDLRLDQVLVEHDRVISTGSTTSYLNLALNLVERFAGPDMAAACAKFMLIDANRTSQAPYMTLTLQDYLQHDDALVLRAQEWIRGNLQQPFGLEALAKQFNVSTRTLIRRFKQVLAMTPGDYCQLIRLDVAKRLLETTSLSLDQVCERIGYGDASSFRRLFKRETGLSPRGYRLKFARRHANWSSVDNRIPAPVKIEAA